MNTQDASQNCKMTPLVAQYTKIRQEYPEYLLFFRLGDFYELFFEDAKIVARTLGLTLTHRGKYNDENIPMCGVPFHSYETHLARLVKAGFKIAICEQTEDPQEAKKRGGKTLVQREVVRLVTAGTITEDPLLNGKSNNFILSYNKFAEKIGCAWMDISTGEIYTQDFTLGKENEASILSMMLLKVHPAEIIVPESHIQNKDIYNLLKNNTDQVSIWPDERFNPASTRKVILDAYHVNSLQSFGDFTGNEICAAGALIDYVQNSQKGNLPLLQPIVKMASSTVMEIDNATRRSLELTLNLTGTHDNTLLKSIDYTLTAAGGRLLTSRINNPLKEKGLINARLDMIEFFINYPQARQEIRRLLKEVSDIERATGRLIIGKGGPRDMVGIKNTLNLTPKTRNILRFKSQNSEIGTPIPPVLQNIMTNLGEHSALIAKLHKAINTENTPQYARDGNFILSGYSAALDSIRDLKENSQKIIANLQDKYIDNTGITNLRVKFNSLIGYFIEVPNKNAEVLLHNPDFIFRQSVLAATRFTTVELTELENEVRSASDKYLALELEIFNDLLNDIRTNISNVIKASQAFAELDVASSLAELAVENNYCRPFLDDSRIFSIEGGRHPVVEQALKANNGGNFIANDCYMDDNSNNLWLLTGPNMAGKSTFMRQNAIIAIMAQMGSYVPATKAHIGIINKMFSRVGASDDLARGQSTFMVEMVETAAILNKADDRSFVILDEIGRGTATFDGLSIAWAVVEYLHNVNHCRTIFATHYHELTALKGQLANLSLHCMRVKEFNNEVIFMHEVAPGNADRSYGINVAQIAGLPSKVIKRANTILHNIEKQNKGLSTSQIAQELPLFEYVPAAKEHSSAIEQELQKTNLDDLTPREAMEKLYELKSML